MKIDLILFAALIMGLSAYGCEKSEKCTPELTVEDLVFLEEKKDNFQPRSGKAFFAKTIADELEKQQKDEAPQMDASIFRWNKIELASAASDKDVLKHYEELCKELIKDNQKPPKFGGMEFHGIMCEPYPSDPISKKAVMKLALKSSLGTIAGIFAGFKTWDMMRALYAPSKSNHERISSVKRNAPLILGSSFVSAYFLKDFYNLIKLAKFETKKF